MTFPVEINLKRKRRSRTQHGPEKMAYSRGPKNQSASERTQPNAKHIGRPTILIAEDDPEMRSLLFQVLHDDYSVVECTNGIELGEAVSAIVLAQPTRAIDLIISDINMPGMNGLEIVRHMHMWNGFPPVVLITAFGDERTHVLAATFGAAATLDKPINMHVLLHTVESLLCIEPFEVERSTI